MDVVLEVVDTFVLDHLYAYLLPIHPSVTAFNPVSTLAASLKNYVDLNASFPAIAEYMGAESGALKSAWTYQPSSQYLSLQPSEAAYLSRWDRENIFRQVISLYAITWAAAVFLYFFCSTLSYLFVFDKTTFDHPKYLKNQMRMEIQQTLSSIPVMAIFTVPFFVAEVRGHSYMYDDTSDPGFESAILKYMGPWYNLLQLPMFLLFTDFFIYWIHRALHHPILYKRFHKPHHKWIMPTPYASFAFHPLDGYSQSVPYHVFPFIFPLHKLAYLALFTFIQIWTVMIHDGEYIANSPVINGAACHTMHHLYFNYNYGQFTTLWDRLGGSYRKPNDELFEKEKKMSKEEWSRQAKEMEKMVIECEGQDDRSYISEGKSKKTQ